jgi:hypothetical protein
MGPLPLPPLTDPQPPGVTLNTNSGPKPSSIANISFAQVRDPTVPTSHLTQLLVPLHYRLPFPFFLSPLVARLPCYQHAHPSHTDGFARTHDHSFPVARKRHMMVFLSVDSSFLPVAQIPGAPFPPTHSLALSNVAPPSGTRHPSARSVTTVHLGGARAPPLTAVGVARWEGGGVAWVRGVRACGRNNEYSATRAKSAVVPR